MSEPEEIQHIINSFHEMDIQTLNRCLACEAMIRALVSFVPSHQFELLREEYEAGILDFAQQLPPKYQRPEHWKNWTKILEERMGVYRGHFGDGGEQSKHS